MKLNTKSISEGKKIKLFYTGKNEGPFKSANKMSWVKNIGKYYLYSYLLTLPFTLSWNYLTSKSVEKNNSLKNTSKIAVISSNSTSPLDKILMTIFQPHLGFPGWNGSKVHKTFLLKPMADLSTELGSQLVWHDDSNDWRKVEGIRSKDNKTTHYSELEYTGETFDKVTKEHSTRGVILIGHGNSGSWGNKEFKNDHYGSWNRFLNSQTHKELTDNRYEKLFYLKLTCDNLNASEFKKFNYLRARFNLSYQNIITPMGIFFDSINHFEKLIEHSGLEKQGLRQIFEKERKQFNGYEKEQLIYAQEFLKQIQNKKTNLDLEDIFNGYWSLHSLDFIIENRHSYDYLPEKERRFYSSQRDAASYIEIREKIYKEIKQKFSLKEFDKLKSDKYNLSIAMNLDVMGKILKDYPQIKLMIYHKVSAWAKNMLKDYPSQHQKNILYQYPWIKEFL
jgi:hypothetical protein